MTTEEQKKADEFKKAEEEKAALEAKKAEELKKTEEKKEETEKSVTEEDLLKAIEQLEEFAKARREVEEEEEEEEEVEEEEKSYTNNFETDETLEKAIEISPFLEALVKETELSIGGLGKEVNKLSKSASEFDGKYIESLKTLSEIVKGISTKVEESLKSINSRLEVIEKTPFGKAKSIMKAAAIEKSFGAGDESEIDKMPRRKVLDLLEKAVLDGKIRDGILYSFEGEPNYSLTNEHKEILKSYMK